MAEFFTENINCYVSWLRGLSGQGGEGGQRRLGGLLGVGGLGEVYYEGEYLG